MKRAFVTGITGQDGQHLAEFLHGQGYEVFGMVKGQNNPRVEALQAEMPFIELVRAIWPICRRWCRRWRHVSPMRCTTWGRSASSR